MQLKLTDFTTLIMRRTENERLLNMMLQSPRIHPASLVALHQIHTLYSEDSSSNANINRITTNLDAVATDILSLSHRINKLRIR
jgi:hypothetical protein